MKINRYNILAYIRTTLCGGLLFCIIGQLFTSTVYLGFFCGSIIGFLSSVISKLLQETKSN